MDISDFRGQHDSVRVTVEHPPFAPLGTYVEKSNVLSPQNSSATGPGAAAAEGQTEAAPTTATSGEVCNTGWQVNGLRRPPVSQTLPRAPTSGGACMLESYTEARRGNKSRDSKREGSTKVRILSESGKVNK